MVERDSPIKEYTDQSISAVHHALRASRRRLAVVLIAHYTLPRPDLDGPDAPYFESQGAKHTKVSVRQISRDIVCLEEEVPEEHATGRPYRNVYNALVQTHLPRLDEVGAVRFDADRKTVKPGRNIFALSAVAAITSPLAQKLFHATVASLYAGGSEKTEPSISD